MFEGVLLQKNFFDHVTFIKGKLTRKQISALSGTLNYKIYMRLIDFKIAHIKVQTLTYLVLLQNNIRMQDC